MPAPKVARPTPRPLRVTRNLAFDYGPAIRVNAIGPGAGRTGFFLFPSPVLAEGYPPRPFSAEGFGSRLLSAYGFLYAYAVSN